MCQSQAILADLCSFLVKAVRCAEESMASKQAACQNSYIRRIGGGETQLAAGLSGDGAGQVVTFSPC